MLNTRVESASRAITLPYAEPMGFFRKTSPYYSDSHTQLRAAARAFYDRELRPNAIRWDDDGERPLAPFLLKMGAAGLIAALVANEEKGAMWLKKW